MLPMKPARKLAMVALKDIGAFGASAFLRPSDFLGQAIDIAGDERTMPETAALLTQAMGHDFATMFRWFNEVGYAIDIPGLRQQFGIPQTTFVEWMQTIDWTRV